MTNESMMNKINALLNKTVENGATEHEASSALQMAQRLMTQHMIDQSQLTEAAKDKTCKTEVIDKFKTGYDTDGLNGSIARAFDCKCWWNSYHARVTFFGFGEDAKLAAYFYNYLNNAIVNEAEKFKRSPKYQQQKIMGYHPRTIMSSFRKGMIVRLIGRLEELKASRVANVVQATGNNLVVVKNGQVEAEYEQLNINAKSKKSNWAIENPEAFFVGKEKADGVNMSGGIETETVKQIGGTK